MLSHGPFNYNRFDVLNEKKAKPDFLDKDKDGDKKESFKKAVKDSEKGKAKKCDDCGKEDCGCDDKKKDSKGKPPWLKKEDVDVITLEFDDAANWLMANGICKDESGCEVWLEHATEDTLDMLAEKLHEGYKDLPKHKMQDKAAMKPDTARGEKQARKMDLVRNATSGNEGLVKQVAKGQQMSNNKKGLEKNFAKPAHQKHKGAAYKLENQRRQDLNKRYGPKKEDVTIVKDDVIAHLMENDYATNEVSAEVLFNHMSDDFLDAIENDIMEIYVGKHGQTEKQYQDSRSDAGKMISGDSKTSGSSYTSRATSSTGPNPAGGSTKPAGQGRMTTGARNDLNHRKGEFMKKHGYKATGK